MSTQFPIRLVPTAPSVPHWTTSIISVAQPTIALTPAGLFMSPSQAAIDDGFRTLAIGAASALVGVAWIWAWHC